MSDTAAIITTAMTVLGGILIAALTQLAQLRKSKDEGVTPNDVSTTPQPDPSDGWREYVATLIDRAERAEARLGRERDLRWVAIHYARRLLDWASQRFPGEQPPPVPEDLTEYIPMHEREDRP